MLQEVRSRFMHFSKFKLENYKSIYSSGDLSFTPGFNVIIGRNDVGKTSLVEGLSLAFPTVSHLSLKTRPDRGVSLPLPFESRASCTLSLSGDEMRDLLSGTEFFVPLLSNGDEDFSIRRFNELLASGANLMFQCGATGGMHDIQLPQYPYPDTPHLAVLRYNKPLRNDATWTPEGGNTHQRPKERTFGYDLAHLIRARVYAFKAERPISGEASISPHSELANNASNLATVLHYLHTDKPYRFNQFVGLARDVFPYIQQIRIPPLDGTHARIYIGTIEPSKGREDLDIPLADSGTGIGQVLAMLYVVFTAEFSRIIVIDEPQSFLHPGAIYRLFNILKTKFPQHQYIVTTHSPAVIAATDPTTSFLLTWSEGETKIMPVDYAKAAGLTDVLAELGARLADVFGADQLLWVEGATEERCFPLIYRELTGQSLGGTLILGVLNTGDLDSKDATRIFRIYKRISQGSALMPPTVGFLLDRELRTESQRQDLIRESNRDLSFLKHRMYENYLLEPEAIADVLNHADPSGATHVTASDVDKWLRTHGQSDALLESNARHHAFPEETWYAEVDGARVLARLFQELTESRVEYGKIQHGYELTRWLLKHKVETLRPIANAISALLDCHTASATLGRSA